MADGVWARIGRFFGFGPSSPESSPVKKGAFEGMFPKRAYSGHRRFHDFRRDFLAEEGRTPATAETQEEQEDQVNQETLENEENQETQEEKENQETQQDKNESDIFDANVIEEKLGNIKSMMGSETLAERPYVEEDPAETRPVFETHASFQLRDVGSMHAFIGLRYSRKIKGNVGYSRKRVVVGFGAKDNTIGDALGFNTVGDSRGRNRLMDDSGHHSSVATQTKITKNQTLNLFDAIPRFSSEFNYNVIGTNCNDFVRTMAKIVGASLPAQLHTAVTGPIGAKINILKAGTGDKKTKIYYDDKQPEKQYPDNVKDFIPWVKEQIISASCLDEGSFFSPLSYNLINVAVTAERKFSTFMDLLEMLDKHLEFASDHSNSDEDRKGVRLFIDTICDMLLRESQKLNVEGKAYCNGLGLQVQAFLKKVKSNNLKIANSIR